MLRVLVVDDDADTVATLRRLLETWGFEAWTAREGQTALEMAEVLPPDVVLLDLAMPGMSGYEWPDDSGSAARMGCASSACPVMTRRRTANVPRMPVVTTTSSSQQTQGNSGGCWSPAAAR
jgi:CheY-like chemotaxis protein